MAQYEFECEKCSHRYTVEESFGEHERRRSQPKCRKCGSQKVRRLLGSVHVQTARKS